VAVGTGDPVATGLVNSLARPGGNLTGVSDVAAELSCKRMELLKEIAPGLRRVAMLWNANDLGMTMRAWLPRQWALACRRSVCASPTISSKRLPQ
jgi:putative ABC transport system substrate-binding protein